MDSDRVALLRFGLTESKEVARRVVEIHASTVEAAVQLIRLALAGSAGVLAVIGFLVSAGGRFRLRRWGSLAWGPWVSLGP